MMILIICHKNLRRDIPYLKGDDETTFELSKEQKIIINYMSKETKYTGLLVYYTVGVGKTYIGAYTALINIDFSKNSKQVIILCPASLQKTWKETFDKIFGKDSSQIIKRYIDFHNYNGNRDNIIKADFSKKFVIIDESHNFVSAQLKLKNKSAQFYNKFINDKKPSKVMMLSATPIINTPEELAYSFNMLSGFEIFKIDSFKADFVDQGRIRQDQIPFFMYKIRGKVAFYMPDANDPNYPSILGFKTILLSMDASQSNMYASEYYDEIKKKKNSRNVEDDDENSTFFVKSRICSNVVTSDDLTSVSIEKKVNKPTPKINIDNYNTRIERISKIAKYNNLALYLKSDNSLEYKCRYVLFHYITEVNEDINLLLNAIFKYLINELKNEDVDLCNNICFGALLLKNKDLIESDESSLGPQLSENIARITDETAEWGINTDNYIEIIQSLFNPVDETFKTFEESLVSVINNDDNDAMYMYCRYLTTVMIDHQQYSREPRETKEPIEPREPRRAVNETDLSIEYRICDMLLNHQNILNKSLDIERTIHSIKFDYTIQELEKYWLSKEKTVVYSFFNDMTIKLFAKYLISNGWNNYNVKKIGGDRTFIIMSGDIPTYERTKLIENFNKEDNTDGNNIFCILGTTVISEGLSFQCLRHTIIMEPYWNPTKVDQILGRGYRKFAHKLLKLNDRTLDAQILIAYPHDNMGISIDIKINALCNRKKQLNDDFLDVLKSACINRYSIVHISSGRIELPFVGHNPADYDVIKTQIITSYGKKYFIDKTLSRQEFKFEKIQLDQLDDDDDDDDKFDINKKYLVKLNDDDTYEVSEYKYGPNQEDVLPCHDVYSFNEYVKSGTLQLTGHLFLKKKQTIGELSEEQELREELDHDEEDHNDDETAVVVGGDKHIYDYYSIV